MKQLLKFIFSLFLISNFAFSQNTIKMTYKYGSDNGEIQDIIDFENIYIETLNFEGDLLNGKNYQINLEEYKNGKLTTKKLLFDSSESDYFKINSNSLSLKFFFKMSDGKLKTYIRSNLFGTKKSYFNLMNDSDKYALKDFFGEKKELTINPNKKNAVFAILTPTIHPDGSGSYCEVAQSDIAPEKLGEHFKIPHYFLVTINFK
ncbi:MULTISPECIES: hypothetical protein [unclassified Empedobacter]|uniref:hypothetical protein n=1 Tax=unclassified Empedobacter TaxID=2643773 RepID=UPI000E855DEB|nr:MULTISPECIES: hypothetical protein [unclassified Empedobacter]MDH1883423.1 hypothetical protein [Empedobacter sp. GD03797]HAR72181.1 hypothetical protein [Flavobacteriaceae bacterium]